MDFARTQVKADTFERDHAGEALDDAAGFECGNSIHG
jgi:hypothetical protein